MPLCDQGQARQGRQQSLFLTSAMAAEAAKTLPATSRLPFYVKQFDFEDQRGVGRNDAARAARPIAERRRDDQCALAADLHRGNAFVPAGNDPFLADRKFERLATVDR